MFLLSVFLDGGRKKAKAEFATLERRSEDQVVALLLPGNCLRPQEDGKGSYRGEDHSGPVGSEAPWLLPQGTPVQLERQTYAPSETRLIRENTAIETYTEHEAQSIPPAAQGTVSVIFSSLA